MKLGSSNENIISKVGEVKKLLDKIFLAFTTVMWFIAFLTGLISMKRYWFDILIQFYFLIILILMVFCSFQKLYPLLNFINKNFGIIQSIKGRGAFLIIVSLPFIKDKLTFSKIISVLSLIEGIIIVILEILVPEPKNSSQVNEIKNAEISFEKNENKNSLNLNSFSEKKEVNNENGNTKNINNSSSISDNQNETALDNETNNNQENKDEKKENMETNTNLNPYDVEDDF